MGAKRWWPAPASSVAASVARRRARGAEPQRDPRSDRLHVTFTYRTMSERSSEDPSSSGEGSGSSPGGQGGGNKDNKLYDKPSGSKRKLIRLLTVMAYVMSVSMAAIMLSLYYVFLWDPYNMGPRYGRRMAPEPHPQMVANATGVGSPSFEALRQEQAHNLSTAADVASSSTQQTPLAMVPT